MKRALLILAGMCAACSSSPERADPQPAEQQLVTRKSEPLVAPPARMGATRSVVDEDLDDAISDLLAAEADSAEVMTLTGLNWADGRRTVAAAHIRYPPDDMSEAEYESSVDQDALQRCDTEFQDCVDGGDSCQEDAYEACIRGAYRNTFVYMSEHLGADCGVLELSMFGLEQGKPRLLERRVIDSMVCEYDFIGGTPSAADLDGDGGPELVYTWSSSDETGMYDDGEMRETIIIFDAETMTEQFKLTRQMLMDEYDEQQDVMGVAPIDPDGDGLFDLQTSMVRTTGYCVGYGWALDARFVVPEDQEVGDPTCQIDIEQKVHVYDRARDVWGTPAVPKTNGGS